MSKKKKNQRLGRGLGSLLGASTEESAPNANANAVSKSSIFDDEEEEPAKKKAKPAPKAALKEEKAKKEAEPKVIEKIVEKKIEVPVEKIVEKRVEVPVEKIVYRDQKIPEGSRIWRISIEKIHPNQFQPRQHFDKEKIEELADSIKEQGILQPIVVRKTKEQKFEIISGERRWRAAQVAGLTEVPVVIKNVEDKTSLELALIENIQRANLNPMEEAEAYQRLADEFSMTQEDIAKKVGKKRASVANTLRLLSLGPEVRQFLMEGKVSQGHAKALLSVGDPIKQRELAKRIINEKLSVRAAEALAAQTHITKIENTQSQKVGEEISNKLAKGIAGDLQKLLGTKVKIDYSGGKGKIQILFYSDDQFNDLVDGIKDAWK